MVSMMDMELRHGRGVAGIEGSTDRGLGMALGCTGFIQEMSMLGSGLVGRAMGVVFILVRMGAVMWGNSSGALNMALDTTITGNLGGVCLHSA